MNLFDILYSGKRDITEENTSAMLGWMLDPGQSHGWGSMFLERFLQMVDEDLFKSFSSSFSSQVGYRTYSPVRASVVLEEPVSPEKDKVRDIDIVMYLNLGEGNPQYKHILIENKIRSESVSRNQLQEEIQGFLNKENSEYQIDEKDVSVVYLTLEKKEAEKREFASIEGHKGAKRHITWKASNGASNEGSIEDLLVKMLEDDDQVRIDPMTMEARWIIKTLIRTIRNDFRSQRRSSKMNQGVSQDYFEGQVFGINELKELHQEMGIVFVGFNGGEKALRNASREYLEQRPYKYDSDRTKGNKNPKNWLKIDEIIKVYDEK